MKSLKAEISKMRRLHHPNIIELLEVQETENSVYLVMEYLRGGPIINNKKDMPQGINEIRTIMRGLLSGIQYLEQNQVVHKDLKPYNILFKENNDPSTLKILDFGLAADLTNEFSLFKIAGTPGFLAPELFKNNETKKEIGLSSKMDVFSAGVILHGYLFKDFIFNGKTSKDVYRKNKKCNFKIQGLNKIDDENLRCPLALDLLRKMLEMEPENRCSVSEALNHEFFEIEENDCEVPDEPVSRASEYLGRIYKSPIFLKEIKGRFRCCAITRTIMDQKNLGETIRNNMEDRVGGKIGA